VIDFRYHVVSIVAVFLALAIGIVFGSTELQGTTIDVLRNTSQQIKNQYDATHARNVELNQQVSEDQAVAQAAEPRLLGHLLSGQRVVLVNAPGAPGPVVTGITSALRQAGATVTGQVNLQPKLLDASQSNQQFLTQLVQQLAAPGSVPGNGTGLQQAAGLLASAILTKTTGSNGGTPGSTSSGSPVTSGRTILEGYAQAGLLSVSDGQPYVPATLAVVITPSSAPAGGVSDPANQGLITLAQQLDTAGLGTVMAGSASGSGPGSAIDALRGSTAAGHISTVDYADTVFGQIVTVQALADALAGRKAASYGQLSGDTAAAPSPAPTPSTSTPPVPSTGPHGKNAKTATAGQNSGASSPPVKSSRGRS
jgi:hypothetical protein